MYLRNCPPAFPQMNGMQAPCRCTFLIAVRSSYTFIAPITIGLGSHQGRYHVVGYTAALPTRGEHK